MLITYFSRGSTSSATPTSVLIILAPWMLLLFWGAPEISASPVPLDLDPEWEHTALDLNRNRNPLAKSSAPFSQGQRKDSSSAERIAAQDQGHFPATLHRHFHIPAYDGEKTVNRERREISEAEKVDQWTRKTTMAAATAPTTTPPPAPEISVSGVPQKENKEANMCYSLCKNGMGGIACNCDLLPVG